MGCEEMENDSQLRGVLAAYKLVAEASWPNLHSRMRVAAPSWATATAARLQSELGAYLNEASAPSCTVRVFWKYAPQFKFGGCNEHFAHDAGLAHASDIVGLTDFDPRIPWRAQAGKYRHDDEEIVRDGKPKLDIIERQTSTTGITWVRAGKAPIFESGGQAFGVLGMYEILEQDAGRKLWAARQRGATSAG
jgi:hypothetical protein